AGSAITWTQMAELNGGFDVWLSPRGNNADFYINSSGTVGIGTTTPAGDSKLDVEGSIVDGNLLVAFNGATTGESAGIIAGSASSGGYGAVGVNVATSGGYGAVGFSQATSGGGVGTIGASQSPAGTGIW